MLSSRNNLQKKKLERTFNSQEFICEGYIHGRRQKISVWRIYCVPSVLTYIFSSNPSPNPLDSNHYSHLTGKQTEAQRENNFPHIINRQ